MSFLSLIQAKRTHSRESLSIALVFFIEVAICAFVLLYGYGAIDPNGRMWALLAAILTLQPGFDQSLAASVTRIIANVIGAIIGASIGIFYGRDPFAVVGAFVLVVGICEYFRLDKGMRTACVSVVIVLVKDDRSVVESGIERVTAVIVGCVVAVLLQLMMDRCFKPFLVAKRD